MKCYLYVCQQAGTTSTNGGYDNDQVCYHLAYITEYNASC